MSISNFINRRRRSLSITALLVIILTILTAPPIVSNAYEHALSSGLSIDAAILKAVRALGATILLWTFQGVMLFVMWIYFLPNLIADLKAIGSGIVDSLKALRETLRAACNSFRFARSELSRVCSEMASTIRCIFRSITGFPSLWRALSAKQKKSAIKGILTLIAFSGIGYLNWDIAENIYFMLPDWLRHVPDLAGIIYLDVFISLLEWALINISMLCLLAFLKFIKHSIRKERGNICHSKKD